jgi:hypothetical protein
MAVTIVIPAFDLSQAAPIITSVHTRKTHGGSYATRGGAGDRDLAPSAAYIDLTTLK